MNPSTVNNTDELGESAPNLVRLAGLVLGPLGAWATYYVARPGLGEDQAAVLALLLLMATWWLTLAVDLALTALLPVLVLPLMKVGTFGEAAAPYANEVIFLFGCGFVLSTALEKYGLSARFARMLIACAGTRASIVIGALMVATALISAFVSNTATTAAMLPVAMSLGNAVTNVDDDGRRRVVAAATLGTAYAATIGGVLTLIGSPPNAIAARYVRETTGEDFTFVGWLGFGLPIGLIMLPLAWLTLVRFVYPITSLRLAPAVALGALDDDKLEPGARRVLLIFAMTALAWLSRPLWSANYPQISDALIAIAGATCLLAVPRSLTPYRPLLRWSDLARMPWGVLILFGGGLSLAAAVDRTGVAASLASAMAPIGSWPIILVVAAVVVVTCFASEIASNTALAATAMPLVGALATATDSSVAPLAIAAALGASMAFMLPVGTPPNAIAFSTGKIRSFEMIRAGVVLNVISCVVIVGVCYLRMGG